jgi:hypothetical protein
MQVSLAAFDALLQKSDSDSTDWADGGGAEEAEEMLAALHEQEWMELKSLCSNRGAAWRACLATVLRPKHGSIAENLLLDLAWDQDAEVAFLAASSIAFYCGVNDSAKGPFLDPKIRDTSFLSLCKATGGFVSQVRKVGASCHPRIGARFELLTKLLRGEA